MQWGWGWGLEIVHYTSDCHYGWGPSYLPFNSSAVTTQDVHSEETSPKPLNSNNKYKINFYKLLKLPFNWFHLNSSLLNQHICILSCTLKTYWKCCWSPASWNRYSLHLFHNWNSTFTFQFFLNNWHSILVYYNLRSQSSLTRFLNQLCRLGNWFGLVLRVTPPSVLILLVLVPRYIKAGCDHN